MHRSRPVPLDEVGARVACEEDVVPQDVHEEVPVAGHAVQLQPFEDVRQTQRGLGAVARVHDDLGQHWIEVGRDLRPGLDARLKASWESGVRPPGDQAAGRREEVFRRVFGVEARLDRMALNAQLLLAEGKRLALGDPNLLTDQVQARDLFRHRVLDLQSRVHLEKVEVGVFVQHELDGSGVVVIDSLGGLDCRLAQAASQLGIDCWRRRLLDDLLVAALD